MKNQIHLVEYQKKPLGRIELWRLSLDVFTIAILDYEKHDLQNIVTLFMSILQLLEKYLFQEEYYNYI